MESNSRSERLESVQGLRGIAALMVVFLHCTQQWHVHAKWPDSAPLWLGGIFEFGWVGVDVFFCISGFIIMWVHQADLGHPEGIQKYTLRRLVRIYPPYLFLSLFKLAFYVFTGNWGDVPMGPLDRVISSLLLLPVGGHLVGVAWTLAYELIFYVLFGAAIVLPIKLTRHLIWLWIALIFFASGSMNGSPSLPSLVVSPYNLEFLCGVLAAFLSKRNSSVVCAISTMCLGLGLYVATLALGPKTGLTIINGPVLACKALLGISGGFCLYGLVQLERLTKWSTPKWLNYIGAASFSIYLVHNELFTMIAKLWNSSPKSITGFVGGNSSLAHLLIALSMLAVVGSGLLYYRYVEKPFLNLGRIWIGKTSLKTP
jgi:exopolysaccharide production protein ExoZ